MTIASGGTRSDEPAVRPSSAAPQGSVPVLLFVIALFPVGPAAAIVPKATTKFALDADQAIYSPVNVGVEPLGTDRALVVSLKSYSRKRTPSPMLAVAPSAVEVVLPPVFVVQNSTGVAGATPVNAPIQTWKPLVALAEKAIE